MFIHSTENSTTNTIEIAGPAGVLEINYIQVPNAETVGVMCHPHSLHGGTMDNKVVTQTIKTFKELNMHAVRFNFRGVGNSTGNYAEGIGETEDCLAVINWAKQQFQFKKLVLAGFSFGSYVAFRAAIPSQCDYLISIAPPITNFNFNQLQLPICPWLIIQGKQDEIIPCKDVENWVQQLKVTPKFIKLDDTTHFFHGKLLVLRDVLVDELKWI